MATVRGIQLAMYLLREGHLSTNMYMNMYYFSLNSDQKLNLPFLSFSEIHHPPPIMIYGQSLSIYIFISKISHYTIDQKLDKTFAGMCQVQEKPHIFCCLM